MRSKTDAAMVTGVMTTPRSAIKIVVIDDDPTGSQTVHSCPLLLRWDVETFRKGLQHPSPLVFVLANTRALSPADAAQRNREIFEALATAMQAEGLLPEQVQLVSRGDSTLRGHGVLEPQVLAEAWTARFGPVDATLHVPAFLEGGRTTVDGVHFLHGEPVHTSVFAQDRLFGYSTSDLAQWLEEKSDGAIPASSVLHLGLARLERAVTACQGDPASGLIELVQWLEALEGNRSVVVDATDATQLQVLGMALQQVQGHKRFVFRSAASLVKGLVDGSCMPLGRQPLDAANLAGLRRRAANGALRPGLVVVGSHVALADQQLQRLLEDPGCAAVEVPVARISRVLDGGHAEWLLPDIERECGEQLQQVLASGRTPVLYTSRGELSFGQGAGADARRLRFGIELARCMGRMVASLSSELGYVICKGGITTGILLAEALDLQVVQLEGQLLPGLSVVRPSRRDLSPEPIIDLPILTFPGNLGMAGTLLRAWRLMESTLHGNQ